MLSITANPPVPMLGTLAWIVSICLACPTWGAEPGSELLATHCYDCHAEGASEGGLALDELADADASPQTRDRWEKVWKMVRQEFMPPADAESMESRDRKALARWIAIAWLGVEEEHPDSGRVTMRRLNRVEYDHSIGDLFGVDFMSSSELASTSSDSMLPLRDMLPPDDTAYGFDNIGDVQTLSPALLEKYFEIAEYVVRSAIVTQGPWYPVRRIGPVATERSGEGRETLSVQTATGTVETPGRYRVEVGFSVGGWQDYGGQYAFTLSVDGQPAADAVIDVGGNEKHHFEFESDWGEGPHTIRLTTRSRKPDSDGRWKPLELEPSIDLVGPLSSTGNSYPISHLNLFFQGDPPQESVARRDYAAAILRRFATRAFRRPVDEDMVDRLTELAMSDQNFHRGVGNSLVAILTSPRFLFRSELQPHPDRKDVRHELDDFELASRLSYLLWLSIPDDELIEVARTGRLRPQLTQQVDRMLADEKSDRFFEDFAGQWLRTRNVLMTPISRGDDDLNPLRGAMKLETEMLFEFIAREDRDLIELVTADYTFVNEGLAEYYGIDGVRGDAHQRVSLDGEVHRGGLLTHASFLVSTSNPDRTSPVKRGLFVLENLLATQPPPPPANVPPLEKAAGEGSRRLTVREQLEIHRADASCASCHAHFDPIGVVLENYDLLGRWRDDERGTRIDPQTTTVTGIELNGIDDLRNYVAGDKERFYRCCTEKLMTYALGRGLEPFDSVTVDAISERLMSDGGRFSTLLLAVIESPAFQMRRGNDDSLRTPPQRHVPDLPPPEQRRPRRRERPQRFFDPPRNERAADPEADRPTPARPDRDSADTEPSETNDG